MRILVVLAALVLTVAASADPPCRQVVPIRQQIVANSIHAATIFADTHLHIVEVPVPAFVFQTLTAYQPVVQVQQQVPAQASPTGIGTDDQLAALLGAPQPIVASHSIEIGQKCGSCHISGAAKGGLTLLDSAGQYNPTTSKISTLTKNMIADRARSHGDDAMPPGVNSNPAKRLSEEASRFLEQ